MIYGGLLVMTPPQAPEKTENTSFADLSRVVYRGSQGIKILPGLEKHGL